MSAKDLTIDELTAVLAQVKASHGNIPVRYDGGVGGFELRKVSVGLDHDGDWVVNLNGSIDATSTYVAAEHDFEG